VRELRRRGTVSASVCGPGIFDPCGSTFQVVQGVYVVVGLKSELELFQAHQA